MFSGNGIYLRRFDTIFSVFRVPFGEPEKFIFLESNSVSLLPRIVDKYRRNLVEPLKNSPRSVSNRAIIEKGLKEPIDTDEGPKLLTQSLIDETLIISEIYNLDEIKTLELLWAAENHLPQYPGLTRGLGRVIDISNETLPLDDLHFRWLKIYLTLSRWG